MKFVINNKSKSKEYRLVLENWSECRHWIINHLDLSDSWEVFSIRNRNGNNSSILEGKMG